jgi:hypothetical protein
MAGGSHKTLSIPIGTSMRTALLFCILALTAPAFAGSYPGSPAAVVAAYVEADGAGMALDSTTAGQVLKYTTWEDAPGWDSFAVIKSYDIGEVGYDESKASVQITYHLLGQLAGSAFTAKKTEESVSFELQKVKGQWKIEKPQLSPHLEADSAITFLKTIASDDPSAKASLKKIQSLK